MSRPVLPSPLLSSPPSPPFLPSLPCSQLTRILHTASRPVPHLGKFQSYTDIQILIWAFGLNLLSSFMLYDFGPSKTIFASTYLSGSLVFLNAAIIMNVFG